jgi:uncharacterized protein (DUF302 family)
MRVGLINLASPFGAAQASARLDAAVRRQGLSVFAMIDHAQAAQDNGLELKPARLVIFGSPRVGTSLMRRALTLARVYEGGDVADGSEDGLVAAGHQTLG